MLFRSVARKKSKLYIGVPKEGSFQESRVALVPEAVALLTNNGHSVVIETNAGKTAKFSDNDYSEAGAQIVHNTEDIFKANIVMKVGPPTLEEIKLMHGKQTFFSALQITVQPKNYIKNLIAKKVSAIAFDTIKDEDGIFSVIRSMGEIAGNTAV